MLVRNNLPISLHLKTGLLVRLCFADEARSPVQHKTTADWIKHIQSVDESEIGTSKYLTYNVASSTLTYMKENISVGARQAI